MSPPGLGKKFIAATIVNHAHSTGVARRLIVLSPPEDLMAWHLSILSGNDNAPTLVVDRRCFRELEDAQPAAQDIWPNDVIALMSVDFARESDVADALAQCHWDLLLVDEEYLGAPRIRHTRMLQDLINRSPQMRVLFLGRATGESQITSVAIRELIRDTEVTVWKREALLDHDGKPLLPVLQWEWSTYRRRHEEVRLLKNLQSALRTFKTADPATRFAAIALLQSASSSFYALEQRLLRMRRRNSECVGVNAQTLESDEESKEEGLEEVGVSGSVGEFDRAIIGSILEMLEQVGEDSKFEAMMRLLDSMGCEASSKRHVCILTRFTDTATYLRSAIQERFPDVWLITAGDSSAACGQILADFHGVGGILILTEASRADIRPVSAAILYDLPLNPVAVETRLGTATRIGEVEPVRVVVLQDESGVLSIEELQIESTKRNAPVSHHDIEHVVFSTIE